jgi:hypothetical protein
MNLTDNPQSAIRNPQSAIRNPQSAMGKEVNQMSREQIRKLTSLSSRAG